MTAAAPLRPFAPAGTPLRWAAPAPPPRASEQALWSVGKVCLWAFLAAQFLSLTRLFFTERMDGVDTVFTFAGIGSALLLLPAVVAYGLRSGSLLGRLGPGARGWVVLVLGLSLLLAAYGWLVKGYRINAVTHDLCAYLVVVAAVVLGSMSRVFADLDRVLLTLLLAALVVNALGMTQITDVVSRADADDRAGISIVAYRTQGALAFWPLLFLTARRRRPRTAFLVYSTVFFVLAQQVLFQKRGPTVRVLLFVLVFVVVLPRLHGPRAVPGHRHGGATFAAAGVVALAVALTAAPWLFEGQLLGLLERLSGQAYRGGAPGMLTWENERFFEAAMFLRTVEPQELVLGRGFGGYFVPDTPGWGVFLEDVGAVARRELHVGALMPFFKGGLALGLVYFAGVGLALARGRRFLGQPVAAAAFFVVLVHALFLLQEGWFIMSASFDLVMVGLCMGHLLSLERERPQASVPGRSSVAGGMDR